MLSYAGSQTGHGWAFGLHEALDQTGATLGPLVLALVLVLHGSYRTGYAVLGVTAILALASILVARYYFPRPQALERKYKDQGRQFGKAYWLYVLAAGCVGAGLGSSGTMF